MRDLCSLFGYLPRGCITNLKIIFSGGDFCWIKKFLKRIWMMRKIGPHLILKYHKWRRSWTRMESRSKETKMNINCRFLICLEKWFWLITTHMANFRSVLIRSHRPQKLWTFNENSKISNNSWMSLRKALVNTWTMENHLSLLMENIVEFMMKNWFIWCLDTLMTSKRMPKIKRLGSIRFLKLANRASESHFYSIICSRQNS